MVLDKISKQLTNVIIKSCVEEFNKDENKKKIQNDVIHPVVSYILEKIYPYVFTFFSISIIILIMSILILKKINTCFSKLDKEFNNLKISHQALTKTSVTDAINI